MIQIEIATSVTPFTKAASISPLLYPKLYSGVAGRPASQAANRASARERLSESMCPASASRARLR
jgi:hypothetical protein